MVEFHHAYQVFKLSNQSNLCVEYTPDCFEPTFMLTYDSGEIEEFTDFSRFQELVNHSVALPMYETWAYVHKDKAHQYNVVLTFRGPEMKLEYHISPPSKNEQGIIQDVLSNHFQVMKEIAVYD